MKSRGFTLIELMLVLAITSVIAIGVIKATIHETEIAKAEIAGKDLKAFTMGVRRAIANEGAALAGGPGSSLTYVGFNWLKSASTCGAPALSSSEYLACAFSGRIPYSLKFSTVVTNDAGTGETTAVIRFDDDAGVTPGSISLNGKARIDLAHVTANTATRSDILRASTAGVAGYDAYSVDPQGVIIANASLVPDLDIWLRRDGGNTVTGTIDFNSNDIVNGKDFNSATVATTGLVSAGNGLNVETGDLNVKLGNAHAVDYEIKGFKNLDPSADPYWASEAIMSSGLMSGGDRVKIPQCPGAGTPQVFASPVIFSKDINAEAIGAVQVWATVSGAEWVIHIRVLTPSGWNDVAGTSNSVYRRAMVTVKCSRS